jgi:hypothetical protein
MLCDIYNVKDPSKKLNDKFCIFEDKINILVQITNADNLELSSKNEYAFVIKGM